MGWLGVVAAKPILTHVPATGLLWLVIGGLMYSGVVFYALKRVPYNHVVWHVFVMAGSTCRYFAIVYAVFPHPKA